MNKQALTFLSLFSLILMLSVYYILLPPIENTLPVSEPVEQEQEPENKEADFDSMKSDLDERHNSEVAGYNAIIASTDSNIDQVSEALENIDMVNVNKELEKTLSKQVKDMGYNDAFVEISNKVIKVTIKKEKGEAGEVAKIINAIYASTNNSYLVEVKFIA
ncbi:SpoIIIAH-like family protein [Beduini massiliensis]|uniref:SpoIIIAH-like family protein n=1 Tax=Beduini massiliensis TaxID=1585974 RepID=UPI00059A9E93|nr:SpoIIIAH-like family protein [Beduini massiliensis]